jgi:hypothetical protein
MQSVPITTDVVSSNLDQGNVYNIMKKIYQRVELIGFVDKQGGG